MALDPIDGRCLERFEDILTKREQGIARSARQAIAEGTLTGDLALQYWYAIDAVAHLRATLRSSKVSGSA